MTHLKTFAFGILAASGAMAIELFLSALFFVLFGIDIEFDYLDQMTSFLFIIAAIEEFFKFIFLLKLLTPKNISFPIFTGLIFGLGFSLFEISIKLLTIPHDVIFSFVFNVELVGIFSIHLVSAIIIAYLINKKNIISFYQGIPIIILTSLIHSLYNLLIIYRSNFLLQ